MLLCLFGTLADAYFSDSSYAFEFNNHISYIIYLISQEGSPTSVPRLHRQTRRHLHPHLDQWPRPGPRRHSDFAAAGGAHQPQSHGSRCRPQDCQKKEVGTLPQKMQPRGHQLHAPRCWNTWWVGGRRCCLPPDNRAKHRSPERPEGRHLHKPTFPTPRDHPPAFTSLCHRGPRLDWQTDGQTDIDIFVGLIVVVRLSCLISIWLFS